MYSKFNNLNQYFTYIIYIVIQGQVLTVSKNNKNKKQQKTMPSTWLERIKFISN